MFAYEFCGQIPPENYIDSIGFPLMSMKKATKWIDIL